MSMLTDSLRRRSPYLALQLLQALQQLAALPVQRHLVPAQPLALRLPGGLLQVYISLQGHMTSLVSLHTEEWACLGYCDFLDMWCPCCLHCTALLNIHIFLHVQQQGSQAVGLYGCGLPAACRPSCERLRLTWRTCWAQGRPPSGSTSSLQICIRRPRCTAQTPASAGEPAQVPHKLQQTMSRSEILAIAQE